MQALKTSPHQPSQPVSSLLTSAPGQHDSSSAHTPLTVDILPGQLSQADPAVPHSSLLQGVAQQQQQHSGMGAVDMSTTDENTSWQSPPQTVRANIIGLDQLSAVKQGRPEGQLEESPALQGTATEAAFDAETVSTDMEAGSVLDSIEVSSLSFMFTTCLPVYSFSIKNDGRVWYKICCQCSRHVCNGMPLPVHHYSSFSQHRLTQKHSV